MDYRIKRKDTLTEMRSLDVVNLHENILRS